MGGETASASQTKSWSKSNKLLQSAYRTICDALAEKLRDGDAEDVLIELEEYIAKKVCLIAIQVGDDYDAFVIFETLNDRGLELAVSDLVKNYLFSLSEEKLPAFKQAWSEIGLLVGGEYLAPFLRHLWLSEFPFVRERDLYRALRARVKTKSAARSFVEKLRKSADLYAALLNSEAPYWFDAPKASKAALRTLRLFRVSQYRPLALAVMEGGTPSEVESMLQIVLVISLRYTVVSGYNASELERIYSDAAQQLRKTGKRNPKAIFDLLKAAYVDDKSFGTNFTQLSDLKADIARYLLAEINRAMTPDGAVAVDDDKVSLEHILPRNPGTDWPGAVPVGEDADQFVESIGNLTLLEKSVNRSLGGKDFPTKTVRGYKKSTLALNTYVAGKNKWTSKEIGERASELATRAKKVWRLDL